jgi:hypothetical protein
MRRGEERGKHSKEREEKKNIRFKFLDPALFDLFAPPANENSRVVGAGN